MPFLYLTIAIMGAIFPYAAFLPWVIENGVNPSQFLSELTQNPVSIFAWVDVVIAAIALIIFIITDGKRHQIRYRTLAIAGTLTIGVSFGLPFYLYLREKVVNRDFFHRSDL
ncbi:DUF2834 domain-containing protein [Enterovibrio nigricans]|uniref:DUF2834 domain-containing protein n=1 Tax=Enterovibrio nigricans DSM 22720 TaxID=1121868 RepID=A0A1T4V0H9_9GAMM|nr:DUF2834 domain-containing protein [Enterovibrio nigricans]PKF49796.1 DUF2834 domain-containing protein [Enterovibrio nigricans]SKA58470.1 Protein of unknown function [Enterovibrio nigricans DSM 22720]